MKGNEIDKIDMNCTVLIVDDCAETLRYLSEVLESFGAKILIAMTGEMALKVISEKIPDIILLDAVMPGMGGFETCLQIKKNAFVKHIPVIFMTGLANTESIVRGLNVGGVDYLVKPVNGNELVARIKTHIAISKLSQQAYAAMDEAQRFLIAIDDGGQVIWLTPEARRIIKLLGPSIGNLATHISNNLVEWIHRQQSPDFTGPRQLTLLQNNEHQIFISYIGKTGTSEHLARLIEYDFEKARLKLSLTFGLTNREAEVLTWISNGKSDRDIGTILSLSPRTINKHLEHIHKKLGVENRTSAAAMAIGAL